jgi:hypothetical protein
LDQAVLQDVAAQDEQPADDVLPIFPPNLDINRSAFLALHEGQATAGLSLPDRNKTSKVLLHFLHLNSYMGMFPSFVMALNEV